MKHVLWSICILWITMATEMTLRSHVPNGALLLPLSCAMVLWSRRAAGVLTAGAFLLINWVARPDQFPVCPLLLPPLMVAFVPRHEFEQAGDRRLRIVIPDPLRLPILTLLAVGLNAASRIDWNVLRTTPAQSLLPALREEAVRQWPVICAMLLVAIPMSALLTVLMRVGDEFGMRRAYSG